MRFNPMRYDIPVLKRVIPSLKKRWANLISKNGFIIHESNGGRFLLNCNNFVDRQIAFYDDYEAAQLQRFETALRRHECDLFLDVGANLGYYSILMALRDYAPRIVAFEPDARNRHQLGANILMNRLTDKIEVVPKAVTSFTGTVKFQPWAEKSTGQSQISKNDEGIDVDAVSLDDFVKEQDARIFIKMDIEGHELEAIHGMEQLATANKIFLQVESFPENFAKVRDALVAMGLKHQGTIDHDHYFSNF